MREANIVKYFWACYLEKKCWAQTEPKRIMENLSIAEICSKRKMDESSQTEAQGEETQSFFDVMHAVPATYVFQEISYTSPRISKKPECENTRASDKKKTHRDQSQINED